MCTLLFIYKNKFFIYAVFYNTKVPHVFSIFTIQKNKTVWKNKMDLKSLLVQVWKRTMCTVFLNFRVRPGWTFNPRPLTNNQPRPQVCPKPWRTFNPRSLNNIFLFLCRGRSYAPDSTRIPGRGQYGCRYHHERGKLLV